MGSKPLVSINNLKKLPANLMQKKWTAMYILSEMFDPEQPKKKRHSDMISLTDDIIRFFSLRWR